MSFTKSIQLLVISFFQTSNRQRNWGLLAITLSFCLFIFGVLAPPTSAAKQIVKVCGEEYPPYSFSEMDTDGRPTGKLRGATVDFLAKVSRESDFEFEITLMPWARCVASVTNYRIYGDFEMFIDATTNAERRNKYLATSAVYKTRSVLFYSRNQFPNGISDASLKTIEGKKFCGLLGNNQSWLEELEINLKFDFSYYFLKDALRKVSTGHCDFVEYSIEIALGKVLTGSLVLSEDLGYVDFPGGGNTNLFYHWISNSSPRKDLILDALNKQVLPLQGESYEKIYRRYLPEGSGL